ncbi:MAG: hypothetical protein Q8N15_07030, partial [Bacillota bacterium]|nr:hypothetical protein [Bacillota bacterium]
IGELARTADIGGDQAFLKCQKSAVFGHQFRIGSNQNRKFPQAFREFGSIDHLKQSFTGHDR